LISELNPSVTSPSRSVPELEENLSQYRHYLFNCYKINVSFILDYIMDNYKLGNFPIMPKVFRKLTIMPIGFVAHFTLTALNLFITALIVVA